MKPSQTYVEWVAELRGAARECMFECAADGCRKSFLDSNIRDMIIMHTPHDKVRSAALQKPNPTLDEVLQIATVYESTIKTCLEIKGEGDAPAVDLQDNEISGNVCNTCSFTEEASQLNLRVSLRQCVNQHPEIFLSKLGNCKTFKANITLQPKAKPKFFKPYNLPFALHADVKAEIERLVKAEVLKPIRVSEWAAPIVVVRKPNGKFRICADFKVALNSQIQIDRYPIPRIEELFHKLQGGKYFTKIDLSDAYLQVNLTDEAKKFTVINTPFGLFQFQSMPFGMASAPGIFQRFMEEVIAGVPHCAVYLDDIIVTGQDNDEHIRNVEEIFKRLSFHGLTCRVEKCNFAEKQVEYVGHIINATGIMPSEKRVDAIKRMPPPKNIKEIESFIGK
ncbi:PREDICTED: uncharacterized protein K02A2.6-like, partial [Rhagoletis zephyria]|uniref:uncharacterized protein K02A2.6-like n=1 Tax=Rhagoletis zephyria TaxID=28612 RepID=UPI000811988C